MKPESLFSYVVRYDSGFAPNPFYGYCTLATCKPDIRKHAEIGDWVIGTGSANKDTLRGGYLVYAMRVSEILSTLEYWRDQRFQRKKPNLSRTWMTAAGDNIYDLTDQNNPIQLNSYHSIDENTQNQKHMCKDLKIQKVLVSDTFVYWGGQGPKLPKKFNTGGDLNLVKIGAGRRRIRDKVTIETFENWLKDLDVSGIRGRPLDWIKRTGVY